MKTSKIKNLILIISIIYIVNIISIGTVNAIQKAWDKTEAKTERIQISRYILANENQKTKSKYPSWTILTTNEISKLDKNGDKKVDKNDLIKVKRHILAMENSTKKREHPDWIIYEEIVGESIELDKTTLTLENGKKGTLKATITSGSTTDNSITWSSTNTAVATVDSEGNVTAKKAGTVTVEEPVAGIKLNKTTITMDNKRATILGVTITPTNATNKTVTWSSSNTSIATVEKNGRVTAKKEGTATITVKSSNGKTATCKVTVEEPVTSIKMNKTTLALDNQKTETLKTTITPTNATNKTVTWSSSNEAVNNNSKSFQWKGYQL